MIETAEAGARAEAPPPRFVVGSTMRHVVVMTATGSVGLIAIFTVDLLSLLYISWLGDPRLTAAVGFATIVLFLATSINVGLMIAIGALVSRTLGAGERARARRLGGSTCTHGALTALVVAAVLLAFLPSLLGLLGAAPDTLATAQRFLWITLPSNVFLAVGMAFSGVLRAVGDARRAMYVTLSGAIVTVFLDPLLIFGAGLGVDGAAIATVVSRMLFAFVGFHGAARIHDLVAWPRLEDLAADFRPMFAIAGPAVLTNVATPAGGAFFAGVVARFGNEAIAGTAIIDRLVPVAFGGIFALSGAIGPILGQNWGARRFDRMRRILRDGVLFLAVYVGVVWIVLLVLRLPLIHVFNLSGLAAELVGFYCLISGPTWLFLGLLFLANASFNNLGFPVLSTLFNWARATFGTVPFALVGAKLGGPEGALLGVTAGAVLFGLGAIVAAFWTIDRLERRA
jgi:putative MATE family efflux protein